jgi:hypothetical protein
MSLVAAITPRHHAGELSAFCPRSAPRRTGLSAGHRGRRRPPEARGSWTVPAMDRVPARPAAPDCQPAVTHSGPAGVPARSAMPGRAKVTLSPRPGRWSAGRGGFAFVRSVHTSANDSVRLRQGVFNGAQYLPLTRAEAHHLCLRRATGFAHPGRSARRARPALAAAQPRAQLARQSFSTPVIQRGRPKR